MINVFQPSLGQEELQALAEVFSDNWPGHGARTAGFEKEFAAHIGVPDESVLFLNNATAGLFLAMELLMLKRGDEVVLPSVSFVSAANAVAATGAVPVFCDVDPYTLNPTVEDIEAALTPRTRAVCMLHYGGYPGEVARIADLCRSRGIPLLEDAACAVASRVEGRACGTFGELATWSFDSMKTLVTGDGGMLYVRDEKLMETARRLAYYGTGQRSGFTSARVSDRWWELDVEGFGRRLIGNDLTAAIGRVQLRRLPGFISAREKVAARYTELLADMEGVRLPPPAPPGHTLSHYFYWVQLDSSLRDQVAADLRDRGVYTTFRYPPLHRVPAYGSRKTLPATDRAAEETLLLPLHQGLSEEDVEQVARELRAAVARRGGGGT
ncbi:DegT/DnrJ/EryC1/StrS family aminotransferase [Streptomyces sp. VNUA24]|uniref:DegT/DnrJ/EryC1/StrS family aminotransferase n=1 Tax=Streptomyces sp. VNUA24 TaxID=3031131 RepID=UPI0023B86346|nr:DegT/DnrJ/EryC1/StrS family aminotransferase [Streptomyces sp. VNUA24]WEH14817.1 DegT/DnrJ/EryC1/StrS family aminotransferase [Streptomyces sp. VNUA24]